jgi:L-arabinose transport system substrate-binding protein
MKKLLALVLTLVLLASIVACSNTSTSTSQSDTSKTTESKTDTDSNKESQETGSEEPLLIGYLAKNMTVQWMQDMEVAMEELGKEYNFTLITANAASSPETQVTQLQEFITQKVDGIITLIADEGIAPSFIAMCNEAGIPIVGESIRLIDDDGNLIAPCVELSANDCGSMCSQWIYDNYKTLGFDLSDLSNVGFATITNSTIRNNEERCDGAENKFLELFPNFPKENVFRADVAGETSNYSEAAYNQIASMITANPDIKIWLLVGSLEEYAQGACRAIEAAGLVDNTILTSIGGERVTDEWDGGLTKPWYAASYYEAMDCASIAIDGLLSIIRDGTPPEDVFSEYKEEGAKYASAKFSGRMITKDNYKEIVSW